MKIHSIETGLFKLDGGAMFGVVPKSIWQRSNPADAHNLCTWAMRCMLIEQDNRLILIDTGIGNKQDEKFFSHYYLHGTDSLSNSLKHLGYSLDDISDVFLTHLHFDHVGGAVERLNEQLLPTFKQAKYWSNEKHWDWAVNPNPREKASFLKENILPIQESGQLNFVEEVENTTWMPNIQIGFAYGHTDAMMLPKIQYKDKTIVYPADLLPSVGHIPLPYVMAYDMFPLQTLKEKQQFLEEAADNEYILFLEHDPFHECCTVQRTDRGIRLKDTFKLQEIL